ncbi:MAG TPA: T9SS type A sorting domain-containing protein [Bacteroidia bacterium]|nr:T9SS type A sorting domain-containing protein [Bacteroidia bacterium]
MKHTFIRITLGICLAGSTAQAQEWLSRMNQAGSDFYSIREAFNEYWKTRDITEPGNGYKPFKRWEYFVEPRVYPSGDLSLISKTWSNYLEFFETYSSQRALQQGSSQLTSSITWTAMGPMGPMSGVATNGFPRKAGRDNFITFHPTNPSIFWAGAPAGGLWKTIDGGQTWSTNTDYLSVIGCSDLAVDPVNPNIMYLATGDGDAGDTYCIGVLKSTDGGQTWLNSGLTFPVSAQRQMRRLIINPLNPQILLAATNAGVYRSTNAGNTWSLVLSGDYFDMEFKPAHPNSVYLSGTSFRVSNDGGATFTLISNGIPTTACNRMAIGVSPADSNYVYALRSSSSSSGYAGLYRSTDGGQTFSVMSTSPDILANACNGTAGNGQGWYDLAVAVSPSNKDLVSVGGVNVWNSNAGGATGTWTNVGCWIGTSAPGVYLKADHHDLEYDVNGNLYSASDGGIFKYNVSSWIDLNNQRNIAQIYKIGLSSLTANRWITGHQDNGTGLYTGSLYQASYAGDGTDCFIDRTNDQNLFTSTPNGSFVRSTNGGASYSGITSGLSGTGAWVTPWKQDPQVATRLYAGRQQMFVSNNLGTSWTQLTATGGGGSIVEFAIAPSNNQIIYVIHGSVIRKTTDGGLTWTAGGSSFGGAPTFITISLTDPNKAWLTVSGYVSGSKVFQTLNGGSTWTNISYNLPNIPANCSVYEPGSSDKIYVGMDVGVYYKDINSNSWTLYNQGLPNTPVSDLEISPAAPGILRAATYGRGVYQVDLAAVTSAPSSSFAFSGAYCDLNPKIISDASGNSPSAWSWSVNPSSGVIITSPNSQNPVISFPSPGVYTVSLQASNSVGPGNVYTQTLLVNPRPMLVLTPQNSTICLGESINLNVVGANSYTWQPGSITGSTISVSPAQSSFFSVTGKDANACTSKDSIQVMVDECVGLVKPGSNPSPFSIFPNPAKDRLSVICDCESEALAVFTDAAGREVLVSKLYFAKDRTEQQINLNTLPKGAYILRVQSKENKEQIIRFIKE